MHLSRRSALRMGGLSALAGLSGCSVLGSSGTDRIDWTTDLEKGVAKSPLAIGDGLVYVGMQDVYGGDLLALDAETGDIEWRKPRNGLTGTPAVADSLVITTTYRGNVRCHDAATGEVEWEEPMPSGTIPLPAPKIVDDTVYVGTTEDLRALSVETGETLWRQQFGKDRPAGSPAVADGELYVKAAPLEQGNFSALDAATGGILWTAETERQNATNSVSYAPAVGPTTVYVSASAAGWVHAFDRETGDQQFELPYGDTTSSPTLSEDLLLFSVGTGESGSTLYAVDPADGEEQWTASTEGWQGYANPSVRDGTVYVGHWADADTDTPPGVVALDLETGDRKWSAATDSNVSSTVAVGDERLYVPADTRVHAIDKR